MTSAQNMYNLEHKGTQSPAAHSSIFEYGIFDGVGQFVEVQSGDQNYQLIKMSEADLIHTLVHKGIIEQLLNSTRSGGYVYVNPCILSDKPIVMVVRVNVARLL